MTTIDERVRALGELRGEPSFASRDIEATVDRRRARRRAGIAVVSVASVAVVIAVAASHLLGGDDNTQSVRTGPASEVTATTMPGRLYEADVMVLENADDGPELCLGTIAGMYPPNCGGTPVVGWDWSQVVHVEREGDIRWADVHVIGTFDGETFTLTERPGAPEGADAPTPDFSPACDHPTGDLALNQGDALGLDLPGNTLPTFPGQVALWLSQGPPFVVNVVVLPGNGPAATAQARELWSGGLCVVERNAPTQAELAVIQNEITTSAGDGSTPLGQIYSVGADNIRGVVVVGVTVVTDEAVAYARDRWGDLVELRGQLTPVEPET